MADSKSLPEILRWHHGDPPIWLELILNEVEGTARQQIVGHYLDAVAANLQANLKLVESVRAVVAKQR
jgi:hypothetical protein